MYSSLPLVSLPSHSLASSFRGGWECLLCFFPFFVGGRVVSCVSYVFVFFSLFLCFLLRFWKASATPWSWLAGGLCFPYEGKSFFET